jgi:predicted nucleic acid-binding protein
VRFLVDANVLSEGTKKAPDAGVVDWLRNHKKEIAIDPVILGEIRFGILMLPLGKRRRKLEDWFERGVRNVVCVPWDSEIALRWAQLLADLRLAGTSMSVKDSLIAATALEHDMIVATRNEKDFRKAKVGIVNPFSDATS